MSDIIRRQKGQIPGPEPDHVPESLEEIDLSAELENIRESQRVNVEPDYLFRYDQYADVTDEPFQSEWELVVNDTTTAVDTQIVADQAVMKGEHEVIWRVDWFRKLDHRDQIKYSLCNQFSFNRLSLHDGCSCPTCDRVRRDGPKSVLGCRIILQQSW